jgi:hypothetical protein
VQAVHAVMGDVDDEPLGGQAAAYGRGEPPLIFHHKHPHVPSLAHAPGSRRRRLRVLTAAVRHCSGYGGTLR